MIDIYHGSQKYGLNIVMDQCLCSVLHHICDITISHWILGTTMSRNKRKVIECESELSVTEVTEQLQSKRTNTGTKQNYRSKVNIMAGWMKDNHARALNAKGAIIIPVEKDTILQFFGAICSRASALDATDDPGALNKPLSVSCVKGYRSALVDLYKQQHIRLDETLDAELKGVLDGYEKMINDLKKRGKMKIHEGKRHLKSNGFNMLAYKFMTKPPREKGSGE